MKVLVKTVSGETDSVEAGDDWTIQQLHEAVATKLQFAPEGMKMVRRGQVLPPTGDQKLVDLGIQDSEMVVVVGKRPADHENGEGPETKRAHTGEEAGPGVPSDLEAKVGAIMDMGFPREKVVEALQAAYNDSSRAVDYLINGIPENVALPPTGEAAEDGGEGYGIEIIDGEDDGEDAENGFAAAVPADLMATLASPEFDQLRVAAEAGGGVVPDALLEAFHRAHPSLQEFLSQNGSSLQQLVEAQARANDLAGDDDDDDDSDEGDSEGDYEGAEGLGANGGAENGDGEYGDSAPLAEEEEAAVTSLTALGFDRETAVAAYIACGKNEQLAASYLFEMPGPEGAAEE